VGSDDWYRGPDWDPATQQEFEERLARARGQRPQYLRIKGLGLTDAEDPAVRAAGRTLLLRVLEQHPDEGMSVIAAHHDLGASYAREGDYKEASRHLAESLRLQRERNFSYDTGVALALAEAIVAARWDDRYQEALELLNEHISVRGGLFPIEQFRILLAEARIAERVGDAEVASRNAEHALALLAENKAPFSRHPTVGLIHTDAETFRELERLAAL
jgi:ATP/maltotriose-dependent transcriptional regulator MalT